MFIGIVRRDVFFSEDCKMQIEMDVLCSWTSCEDLQWVQSIGLGSCQHNSDLGQIRFQQGEGAVIRDLHKWSLHRDTMAICRIRVPMVCTFLPPTVGFGRLKVCLVDSCFGGS